MNKYGYFKYSDIALGANEKATYSSNKLQQPGTFSSIGEGVPPYDFASFEQDSYITSKPKILYNNQQYLGYLTREVSNENCEFEDPIVLTVTFSGYFSMTGITLNSRNIIKEIDIIAYKDNAVIASGTFSADTYSNFYSIGIELANKIEFVIKKIDRPHHFFGLFSIKYGRETTLEDETILNCEIINNFSVLGDTLEYDTLDLTVYEPEEDDYLFQKKQSIDFIVGEKKKSAFFVDSGTETDDKTIQVLAYDEISSLEDEFYGGIYENYPLNSLITDILSGTNIEYTTENTNGILLSGYLPISSRRKALQTILQGSNIRCYKGEKLIFKPLESRPNNLVFNETNIINKPQKNKKQEIKSVTVKNHNYSKGTEETELYHWYISKTEPVRITFSSPAHSVKAYEVTGVDQNGQDIISETESTNVTFQEVGANYVIVSNNSSNKIVIKGLNYTDSTVSYKKINEITSNYEAYEEITIDLTISSNPQEVCNHLYALYSRKNSIKFSTYDDVEIGGYYSILGEYLNIKTKRNTLNGIYEVEAV